MRPLRGAGRLRLYPLNLIRLGPSEGTAITSTLLGSLILLEMRKLFFYPLCLFLISVSSLPLAAQSGKGRGFKADTLSERKLDSIIVASTRANDNTPIAFTTVGRKEIESNAPSHSLPMLIGMQPSVVATTEGGLGLGYTKFSVRGGDASRTNVTLNGIAINDGESQEVFWVNLPSVMNFLQSIQLQRGVGTSTNGPGAFGATLNMQTKTPSSEPYGVADFSFGSYKTFMESVALGTGLLGGKRGNWFSFDLAYNHANTRGYIRNAKARLNSLFFSASWRNSSNSLRFIYIFGDQHTGITWEGCPIDIYPENRKYNVAGEYYDEQGNVHYYDNETDNYTQHHLQLHYIHQFTPALTLNATAHFTKGDGYYENYKYNVKFSKYGLENQVVDGVTYKKTDVIIRQGMDNAYYAGALDMRYNGNNLNVIAGANFSFYDGDHDGNMLWSKWNQNIPNNYSWYGNNGKKREISVFTKAEYSVANGVTAFLDFQYRNINLKMSGIDKDFVSLVSENDYRFFSPKMGINFRLSPYDRFFASLSVGHREPSRSDIKESIKAGKTDQLKKERVMDYELGYQLERERLTLGINLYAMEYKNQLVATGRLTETGYVIQENIPKSYRRGVELSASYSPVNVITFFGNMTLSKNKLKNYTLYVDAYDNSTDWNQVAQKQVFLKSSNLIYSPQLIAMGGVSVNPFTGFNFALTGKGVGKQYMDNSSMEVAKVPAYFTMSLSASQEFKLSKRNRLRISFCVDNLLNKKYYSYGWIYRAVFDDGSADYVEKGVYSQATTNYIAKIQLTF